VSAIGLLGMKSGEVRLWNNEVGVVRCSPKTERDACPFDRLVAPGVLLGIGFAPSHYYGSGAILVGDQAMITVVDEDGKTVAVPQVPSSFGRPALHAAAIGDPRSYKYLVAGDGALFTLSTTEPAGPRWTAQPVQGARLLAIRACDPSDGGPITRTLAVGAQGAAFMLGANNELRRIPGVDGSHRLDRIAASCTQVSDGRVCFDLRSVGRADQFVPAACQ
jgi:hypothetical protein